MTWEVLKKINIRNLNLEEDQDSQVRQKRKKKEDYEGINSKVRK